MPKVQDIYIYPVKSCAGIRVSSGRLTERGLENDRRWMIVDEDGKFVTARTEHRLVTIKTAIQGDRIELQVSSQEPLLIPTAHATGLETRVVIWRNTVNARVHEDGSRWFSQVLDRSVRLVYMPREVHRPVNLKYGTEDDRLSFADGYPMLVISQASLDDLNKRLASPVSMHRFRPNLVVSGVRPFEEDNWVHIRAGDAELRAVKPCDRCSLTTVDPTTGKVGKEPLKTLAEYRTKEHDGQRKVLFGMNLIPDKLGTIREGDVVEASASSD